MHITVIPKTRELKYTYQVLKLCIVDVKGQTKAINDPHSMYKYHSALCNLNFYHR